MKRSVDGHIVISLGLNSVLAHNPMTSVFFQSELWQKSGMRCDKRKHTAG